MVKEAIKKKRGPRGDDRSVSSRGTKGARGKSPKREKKGGAKRGKSPKREKSRKDGKGGRKGPEDILEFIPQEYLEIVEILRDSKTLWETSETLGGRAAGGVKLWSRTLSWSTRGGESNTTIHVAYIYSRNYKMPSPLHT